MRFFDFNLKPPDYGALSHVRMDVLKNCAFPEFREDELLTGF
jgi:hypothetical protein